MLLRALPNALSIFRALLLIPIFFALKLDSETGGRLILILLIIAGLTDFFDGYLARRWGFNSQLGRILDPLADKIFAGGLVLTLALEGRIPVWFCVLIISRDICIIIGSALLLNRMNLVKGSNTIGKWAFTFILFALISAILDLARATPVLIVLSTVFVLFSVVSYGHEFAILYRKRAA